MSDETSRSQATSPCRSCGGCCAAFRVDFHVAELAGGVFAWDTGVPREMTVPVTSTLVRMRGTDASPPRCVALRGEIGRAVECSIYPQRPSPCREFGTEHEVCARIRRKLGLTPVTL